MNPFRIFSRNWRTSGNRGPQFIDVGATESASDAEEASGFYSAGASISKCGICVEKLAADIAVGAAHLVVEAADSDDSDCASEAVELADDAAGIASDIAGDSSDSSDSSKKNDLGELSSFYKISECGDD